MSSPPQSRQFWELTEQRVLDIVVTDQADLDGPSRLPGWNRSDVVGHLIGNARALTNLTTWAATGNEAPMYASKAARNAEIAELATRRPDELRPLLVSTVAQLRTSFDGLSSDQLRFEIRTGQGDARPAFDVAWMRARECAVHLIDLDAGAEFTDLPDDLLDALRDDVIDWLNARAADADGPDVPAVTLHPTDRDLVLAVGATGASVPVHASSAELVAWLQGRRSPGGLTREGWPALPPWL